MTWTSALPDKRRFEAPIVISPPVNSIQSRDPTKEVLHSGLSEKVFRFYAYT
jgi:hypothetical protein